MGTPTGTDPITLTFTTNSGDGAATCTATVNIAIPPMTILGLGTQGGFDYDFLGVGTPQYKMLMDQNNFGTLPASTVKFGDGTTTWKIDPLSGATYTSTALVNDLGGSTPPDIIIIGYPFNDDATGTFSAALTTYLKKGGVVLSFLQNGESVYLNQFLLHDIFGAGANVNINGGAAGTRYLFPNMPTDPVINGPFGNLGGAYWGEDASVTNTVTGLPTDGTVIVYTTSPDGAGTGLPTMFRHSTLSWIWAGDGGFNSQDGVSLTNTTICPFYISQSSPYIPMPKPVQYTSGATTSGGGAGPVSNSIFTANALAWALNQAMINGINAAQR
jgi:hypothetical protein